MTNGKTIALCILTVFASKVAAINYIIVSPFNDQDRAYVECCNGNVGKLCSKYNEVMTCFDIQTLREFSGYYSFILMGTYYRMRILNRSFERPAFYNPEVYFI